MTSALTLDELRRGEAMLGDLPSQYDIRSIRPEARRLAPRVADALDPSIDIVVIDDRALMRECFAMSLGMVYEGISVLCFSSIAEWLAVADRHAGVSLILLCRGGLKDATDSGEISTLQAIDNPVPVIVVSEEEDVEEVQRVIHLGARGFIPASVDLRLAVMAMHLVRAGGTYLPESILQAQLPQPKVDERKLQFGGRFTERQAAVLDALRQGKPNKIIAYELNMRESTVKVHIRNVMKKLNAKNRTEVAFMTNYLFPERTGP